MYSLEKLISKTKYLDQVAPLGFFIDRFPNFVQTHMKTYHVTKCNMDENPLNNKDIIEFYSCLLPTYQEQDRIMAR